MGSTLTWALGGGLISYHCKVPAQYKIEVVILKVVTECSDVVGY